MSRFDNIKTMDDMKMPMAMGGMSMGEGGLRVSGWDNSCPKSPREDGRHLDRVLANVQSVEWFRCEYCKREWND